MSEYVTQKECEEYREKIEDKLMEQALKFVELESNLKHMQATLNLILGALVSGVGSIIVILLTRGIK
jgi:predicted house-cleaning noncanonical NTP pyrophosphatase (MazG superfamily)